MGRASTASKDFPGGPDDGTGTVSSGGRDWEFQHVSIGNPQCAIEVGDELEELDLPAIGPEIERSDLFPNRTNVSFWRREGDVVRARIFERGVGETLSSGTGASGAAVAAHLRGAPSPVTVRLDGGELEVEISADLEIHLTGWAEPICWPAELSPRSASSDATSAPSSTGFRSLRAHVDLSPLPAPPPPPRAASRRCRPTCSPSSSARSPRKRRPVST